MKLNLCRAVRPLLAVAALFFAVSPAIAVEEYARFLEALRNNQMYDVAIEYLEQMKDSDLLPPEIKQTIAYEQGLVLVEQSRGTRDLAVRQRRVDDAMSRFRQFLEEQPDHRMAGMANTQLANVMVEQAITLLEKAKHPSQVANKEKLTAEARVLLQDSIKRFMQAETDFEAQHDRFPKGDLSRDPALNNARHEVRVNLVQSRLFTGRALHEYAKSFDKKDPEYKKQMEAAIAKYKEVSEKYRGWPAANYATMYAGQCYHQLGNLPEALSWYNQLLDVDPEGDELFREVQNKTLRFALECWKDDKKLDEVVRRSGDWLTSARPIEESRPEGLAIAWAYVDGIEGQLEAAKADQKTQTAARKKARDYAKRVAQYQGEFQQPAQEWLSKYAGIDTQDVAGFDQALDEARTMIQAAHAETDPAKRQEACEKTLELVKAALGYRADDTPVEAVNQARYYASLAHFYLGQYYESAVLGNFISRRYPESGAARGSANIEMISWVQASRRAPGDAEFEQQQAEAAANYLLQKWEKEREAQQAISLLIDMYVQTQRLDEAIRMLGTLPPDFAGLADAELKIGRGLWAEYRRQLRKSESVRLPKDDLDGIFEQAELTLKSGIDRMRKEVEGGAEVKYSLLASELSLAQIYLDASKPEEALALITRPTGALELVKAKSPITSIGNFPQETLKAALRGYVGVQKLTEAEEVMKALEGVAKDEEALTRIYIGLGRSLEDQIDTLQKQGDTAALTAVQKGFVLFLDRITQRPGNSYSSLYWVASTYRGMGAGLEQNNQAAQAADYFKKAAGTFQKMQAELPTLIQDEARRAAAEITLKINTAAMLRRAGNAQEALKILIPIVEVKPKSLEGQMETAAAYQALGKDDPLNYLKAMRGDIDIKDADGRTSKLVWGWEKLYAILRRLPDFVNLARECELQKLECQYAYAMSQPDKTQKAWLGATKQALLVKGKYGAKLPSEWLDQFESVLQRVDKALNVKHETLAELQKKAAAEAAARSAAAAASGGN